MSAGNPVGRGRGGVQRPSAAAIFSGCADLILLGVRGKLRRHAL